MKPERLRSRRPTAGGAGIREAFDGFDPPAVAGYGPDDIARLLADPGVIRSRVKIEAIIDNAQALVELADEHRGFHRYLRSHGGFAGTVADLKRQFRYIGDSGAYHFLWSVNEPVPSHEEWIAQNDPNASKSGAHQRTTTRTGS